MDRTPRLAARAAAAVIASASASVLASGFSHSTCLPASRAAMAISAWVSPGVQMSTSCTSSRSITACQSVSTCRQPYRRAAARVAAPSRPASTVIRGRSGTSNAWPTVAQAREWAAPMKA